VNNCELVSVVTPVFNAASYLPKTIDSVLAQDYPKIEYILVDDCSSDHSREIILDYADRDSRVRYVFLENNGGPGRARNIGIQKSAGDFICFLDSDDLWRGDKTKKQIALFHENTKLGLISTNGQFIDKSGEVGVSLFDSKKIRRGKIPFSQYVLKSPPIVTSSVMVKRDCLDTVGLFKEKYFIAEDWELWMRILLNYEIDILDESLILYRLHDSNISKDRLRSRLYKIQIIEDEILSNNMLHGLLEDKVLVDLQKKYFSVAKMLYKKDRKEEALFNLGKAISLKKNSWTTVRALLRKTFWKLN
jgi:glycosyltransferase involved in cell wall biosynthesis